MAIVKVTVHIQAIVIKLKKDMKRKRITSVILILILIVPVMMGLSSCSAPKNVIYMSDLQQGDVKKAYDASPMHAIPGDKIGIYISSKDISLAESFNLMISQHKLGYPNNEVSSSVYTVDENGSVKMPIVGEIKIGGLTREEISSNVERLLTERKLLSNPIVTVDFVNAGFSVLGDVRSPGQYSIDRDKYTIWQALADAGGANLSGVISNVLVLRQENGQEVSYRLDLTNAEETMSSPAYWIRQNDVIYIEPNIMKRRQATVNGNNFTSISFWMSAASLLSTLVVLISRL